MKYRSKLLLVALVGVACGALAIAGAVVEQKSAPAPVPAAAPESAPAAAPENAPPPSLPASPAAPAAEASNSSPEAPWKLHTSAVAWREPRNFQSPFMRQFADRFFMRRDVLADDLGERVYSPNKGYFFSVLQPAGSNSRCGPDGMVYVDTESDHSMRVVFRNVAGAPETRWINEKLLYVAVWWNDDLGSYLILDVETERVLIQEMIQNGQHAFDQTHRGAGKGS